MKSLNLIPWSSKIGTVLAAAAIAFSTSAQPLFGQIFGVPEVKYSPFIKQIAGQLSYTESYTLTVQAPNFLPAPTPVLIVPSVNNAPGGVSNATALSYLSFSVNGSPVTGLTFSSPSQSLAVTVTLSVPANATPGSYGYKILTTGWPVGVLGLNNDAASINATITVAPVPTPPTVAISTPADATVITVPSFPAQINFAFAADSTGDNRSNITSIDADLSLAGGLPTSVALTNSGLNQFNVTASGTLNIPAAGQYTVTARATNSGGTTADVNSFRVTVAGLPPTVVINTPTANSTYTYRAGDPAVVVPYTFTATSNSGVIRTLVAKVDGGIVTFTPSGLNTATATGSINLSYTAGGTHTLEVITTDDFGTDNDLSNFTVNYVAPTPTIDITRPTDNEVFPIPSGSTTTNVPFRFVTTSNNGFVVNSVSAMVGTVAAPIATTTGLGTASAVSEGTLMNLTAGTYTLSATGVSAGINVSDYVTFTVRASNVPPTVVINTPPVGSTYTRVSGGPALSIPLTFTGTSQTPGGVITQLRASLGSTPLAVTATNLNTRVATGAATISVSNAGTYTINVTAIDAYGTANATRTFTVCVVQGKTICGDTYFDVDFDGHEDCDEFGLSGITVRLLNSAGQVVGTDVTDACGNYSFCNIGPGTYLVSATAPAGLKATTLNERSVTVSGSNVCVPDMGFGLNFVALKTMTANGYTIGYWKNNIDKALDCKTSGTQVSKAVLTSYTSKIGDFALAPYDCISLKTASSTMGYNGSNKSSLLSKQLIASEYNYQNGAYLNGNKTLTFLFLYWGEYVLKNTSKYSDTYRTWAKDWFDAYNNSHGGIVNGPNP